MKMLVRKKTVITFLFKCFRFPLLKKVPSRGFQMVRMARLGLVMPPMLSLKVLTKFGSG